MRIVVLLKRTSPLHSSSPDTVVRETCSHLAVPDNHKLLVVQVWPQYTVLVFDIFHSAYDVATSHYKANLPVFRFNYNNKQASIQSTSAEFQNQINQEVANFHNLNSWDREPPYYEDQTSQAPRVYSNPRDTSIM